MEEEILTKKWDDKTEKLAFDLESAFLNVFKNQRFGTVNTEESLKALAIATGHIIQAQEMCINHREDLFSPFWTWIDYAHAYYEENPTNADLSQYN